MNRYFVDYRWDEWVLYYELDPTFEHELTDEGLKTTSSSTPIPEPVTHPKWDKDGFKIN